MRPGEVHPMVLRRVTQYWKQNPGLIQARYMLYLFSHISFSLLLEPQKLHMSWFSFGTFSKTG